MSEPDDGFPGPTEADPPLPPGATDAAPGSPEKVRVMRARLAAGLHLHHPDDARVLCRKPVMVGHQHRNVYLVRRKFRGKFVHEGRGYDCGYHDTPEAASRAVRERRRGMGLPEDG